MKTRPVGGDLASVVVGRHAKIASVYTQGATECIYSGDAVAATCRGQIILPAHMRDPSRLPKHVELLSWSFLNHEMGHEETDRKLEAATQRGEKAVAAPEIHELIPPRLRVCGVETGDPIFRYAEFLGAGKDKLASIFVSVHGGDLRAATSQIQALVNVFEDPRMESTVVSRWKGTERHLRFGTEHALEKWRPRAKALIDAKQDGGFGLFAVALCFWIAGENVAFMGPRVGAQLATVADIVETFRDRADWRTCQGFHDSLNAACATLARVYECIETPKKPQEADEGDGAHGEPAGSAPLKPGMIVRVKATGEQARIVQAFADGSIEVEPIEDEPIEDE